MNKKLKVLSSVLTALVLTTALAGCSSSKSSTSSTSTTTKKESKEILIWTNYQGKDFVPIKKLAEDWAKETGNTVKVVEDKVGLDSIIAASKSSKAPDVMIGYPNDRLGSFVKADIVDEVPAGIMNDSDYIAPAITGSMINGKKYGVPLTLETYVLFYNKDLVPTPPKTWEELMIVGKKVGFNYALNDVYFSLALIKANGGYVFKDNNGTIDTNDIGLANAGAVKGLTMINDLVTSGIVAPSVTSDIAKGNFLNKKIGLYISGNWDVSAFKDKVNFGVATYPQIDGKAVPTTAGVKLAVVSKNSKVKATAWEFMKYVGAKAPYIIFKQTAAIPVLKADQEKDEIKKDPITSVFAEQAKSAAPMLSVPEFGTIWEPGKQNITLMITKKQTPQQAADNIVKQVKEGIATMK